MASEPINEPESAVADDENVDIDVDEEIKSVLWSTGHVVTHCTNEYFIVWARGSPVLSVKFKNPETDGLVVCFEATPFPSSVFELGNIVLATEVSGGQGIMDYPIKSPFPLNAHNHALFNLPKFLLLFY